MRLDEFSFASRTYLRANQKTTLVGPREAILARIVIWKSAIRTVLGLRKGNVGIIRPCWV